MVQLATEINVLSEHISESRTIPSESWGDEDNYLIRINNSKEDPENAFVADSPLYECKSPLVGNKEDMMYKLAITILAHHANLVYEKLGNDAHIDFLNEVNIDVSEVSGQLELAHAVSLKKST